MLLRAEDEPVRTRVDYWRHLMGDALVPLDIRFGVSAAELRDQTRLAEVGAVKVSAMTLTTGEATRGRKEISRSDPDLCKFDVVESGSLVVSQDGRQTRLGPGDLAFVDLSRPCHWATPGRTEGVAVLFPRALLPLRRADAARLTATRIAGDRGAGGLASSLARQLPHHLDAPGPRADWARLGTAVLDVMALAMAARTGADPGADPGAGPGVGSGVGSGVGLPADARRRALIGRVRAYVERQLGDPGLSPATIADAHHVSVRYLHKLFESERTTMAAWIRQRRLERCRRDLLDPARRDRPVSAIAARWGFTSPAHFNRAFRAAYDLPPGEYRLQSSSND
jgi:AraC-like DNA-binding protein